MRCGLRFCVVGYTGSRREKVIYIVSVFDGVSRVREVREVSADPRGFSYVVVYTVCISVCRVL
jgi:hypothetical protein